MLTMKYYTCKILIRMHYYSIRTLIFASQIRSEETLNIFVKKRLEIGFIFYYDMRFSRLLLKFTGKLK